MYSCTKGSVQQFLCCRVMFHLILSTSRRTQPLLVTAPVTLRWVQRDIEGDCDGTHWFYQHGSCRHGLHRRMECYSRLTVSCMWMAINDDIVVCNHLEWKLVIIWQFCWKFRLLTKAYFLLSYSANNKWGRKCYHCQATAEVMIILTRHRVSTSTCWHFAFGSMLSQQRNPCTDYKSAQ